MRDPTGQEPSSLLDPPLEGYGGGANLEHDIKLPFQGSASFRNGNLAVDVLNGSLSFWRIESNGSRSLLTSEYKDTKAVPARYYRQDFRSSSFAAYVSFSSEPGEQVYGGGQQACCSNHLVNKKGQVVDLLNFNSQVTMPLYMSNKVHCLSQEFTRSCTEFFYRDTCTFSICQVKASSVSMIFFVLRKVLL